MSRPLVLFNLEFLTHKTHGISLVQSFQMNYCKVLNKLLLDKMPQVYGYATLNMFNLI